MANMKRVCASTFDAHDPILCATSLSMPASVRAVGSGVGCMLLFETRMTSYKRSTQVAMQDFQLFQHLHPDDFTSSDESPLATSFPIMLTFPYPGFWHLHLSANVSSAVHQPAQRIVSQQLLRIGPAPDAQSVDGADKSRVSNVRVPITAKASDNVQHSVNFMHSSTGGRSDIEAQLIAPDKPVFRHDCNRFEVTFTYANSSKPVTDLQTAPHPSMHALSVAHRNSSNAAAAGAIVMQEWLAWPAAAEAAVLDADKRGLDLCNMDAYYNQDQASSAGGSLVLYMRFEHAGQHQLFLQVLLCTPVSKRAIDDVCTACICTVC